MPIYKFILIILVLSLVFSNISVSIATNNYQVNPAETGRSVVISKFLTPSYYPGDLAWDGSFLWYVACGKSRILKLNSIDGSVVTNISCPLTSPTGLEWDGSALWVADQYKSIICMINHSDGSIIKEIDASSFGIDPQNKINGLSGLAWDGTYIWATGRFVHKIFKIDPIDGMLLTTFHSPGPTPRGIAWDGLYLWVADWSSALLYRISPEDGEVVYKVYGPGNYPTGLAWDGSYLWVADEVDHEIYKIDPFKTRPPETGQDQPTFLGLPLWTWTLILFFILLPVIFSILIRGTKPKTIE